MSMPEEFDFRAETVGFIDLVELDTAIGVARFWVGEDGIFTDTNGDVWYGSKLISVSEVEYSIAGTAPSLELSFSFIQDPDQDDLVTAAREMGVAGIKGRPANFYIQYLSRVGELYAPIFAPQRTTSRRMSNLTYSFDGPQSRTLSLTVEGPFSLRSKPIGARYNTADHSRRLGYENPSLEFMPFQTFDEQPLFGL